MTQVKMDGNQKLAEGPLCIKLKISGRRNLASIVINRQQQAHGGGDAVNLEVDEDGGGRHACPVCGKNFTSEKSLFGHMRCHPDRPWRGIHPPSGYSLSSAAAATTTSVAALGEVTHRNSSSYTILSDSRGFDSRPQIDSRDHQMIDSANRVDLSQVLEGSGWLKTRPRDRKKEIVVEAKPPPPGGFGLQLEEKDAVHDLMLLARAHPNPSPVLHQPANHQEATNSSNSLTNKAFENGISAVDEGESSSRKRTRSPEVDQLDYDTEVVEEQSESERGTRIGDMDIVCITEGGRIIGPNLAILPPTPTSSPPHDVDVIEIATLPERFNCRICNRSFATHQALGGHVSSHNKLGRTKLATEEAPPPPPPMDEPEDHNIHNNTAADHCKTGGDQYGPEPAPATAAQHLCRTCNKMFFTGQALGGHMRCHNLPPPPPPPPVLSSSSIAPPINCASTGSDGGGKAALNFDLNLLAPEAEEPPAGNGSGASA